MSSCENSRLSHDGGLEMNHLKFFFITGFVSLLMFAASADATNLKPSAAISPALEAEVNTQIRHELEAAYFYLGLANVCEEESLYGFAHWFTVQFFEETTHARLLMKFLVDRGNTVQLDTLQATPVKKGTSTFDLAAMGMRAEEEQTARIHRLYELARVSKAYDLENTMAFFVKEQIEEEANFDDLQKKLKLIGNSPEGLLALDRELALRPMPVVQPLPVIGP
jgi:ferritin